MAALDAAKRADQLKDDANRSLHEDRPQEALSLYTKAIGIQPSAVLYANRAAAQMRIGRLQKAIDDADEALKLDMTYAKAWKTWASKTAVYNQEKLKELRRNLKKYNKAADEADAEAHRLGDDADAGQARRPAGGGTFKKSSQSRKHSSSETYSQGNLLECD